MHGSTSTALLVTQLLAIEGLTNQSASFWRDEEFSNTYDRAGDVGRSP
jgi:hypothetical protein